MVIRPDNHRFFKAYPKEYRTLFESKPQLCFDDRNGYIGLRKFMGHALDRANLITHQPVSKHTHGLVVVEFTDQGWAYFSSQCTPSWPFLPLLYKKFYRDQTEDWGVWHLQCEVEDQMRDSDGNVLLYLYWAEIL